MVYVYDGHSAQCSRALQCDGLIGKGRVYGEVEDGFSVAREGGCGY